MARIYPDRFPESLAGERSAQSERAVYDALAGELPDGYVVIHRARWLDPPASGPPRDGECDFIVAHPDHGMLVIEVKGGRVGIDPATGRWVSVDRDGARHEIRDPYDQANSARHVLRRKLESLPGGRRETAPIGHAVVLPHCEKERAGIADGSAEITLDAADLTRPLEAIERLWRFWRLEPGPQWRERGVASLERLFVHRDFARIRLGTQVRQHGVEFVRLTAEQAGILDLLRQQRRAAISGCAGSGKTMLAVEKARRLSSEGFRVLVTCFNRALAEFIRSQLPTPAARRPRARAADAQLDLLGQRVEVESFHRLAGGWARRAGLALEEPADDEARERFYRERLPEALQQATARLPERYDAIIVDEGQDFEEDWWLPLQSLLADPDHGILYVFYDDNQSLYTAGAKLPIETPPYLLTRNCRNTREIHTWVGRWYRGEAAPEAAGPEGRPPLVLRWRDERELREHVRRTLHELVHVEGVAERDLVVLTPRGRATSALWRDPQFGNLRLTDGWPPAPNHVECTTVAAFKGLERPVVVLAEVGRAVARPEELLYVGGSRAMSHLVVIEQATD
jgi:superfamily I DNA/RNA helicase